MKSILFLYGPPGSGKTTTGQLLSEQLGMPFIDLDDVIVAAAHKSIPEIFAQEGEAAFRQLESACLHEVCAHHHGVVALGGGALVDAANRGRAEAAGTVLCLLAGLDPLHERLHGEAGLRPLLGKAEETRTRLADLLHRRAEHYASFPLRLDTSHLAPQEAAWQSQVKTGLFRISGMGKPYPVVVQPGGLDELGERLAELGVKSPTLLVTDSTLAGLYGERALRSLRAAGIQAGQAVIPAGEAAKTIASVARLWDAFLAGRLERASTVLALGGGVVTDLTGFAAATYLRGVAWAALPTSLLGMVDACLGGKTGADLPQGKNLVGAFHPPALVLADPLLLGSLPPAELRNGLAEVVKHGILADPALFELCAGGLEHAARDWTALVRQAMAVKIQFIQEDPYETGRRAALNLGHTLGHAVEAASEFRLRHGEAVSIGLVGEARLAERIGLAEPGLARHIARVLDGLGLPVAIPVELERPRLLSLMQVDKKKAGGKLHFALPVRIGEVKTGVVVSQEDLEWMIAS